MSLPKNSDRGKSNRLEAARCEPSSPYYAVLTGSGRSAIAVIELGGPGSQRLIDRCFRRQTDRDWNDDEIRYGRWIGTDNRDSLQAGEESPRPGQASESVVVIRLNAERWEIHCHGGLAAIERIARDLVSCGAEAVPPKPWQIEWDSDADSERAESFPLLSDEASEVLQQCLTQKTAAIVLDQIRGALAAWVAHWINTIKSSGNHREAVARLHHEASELLKRAELTARMAEPLKVVLAGPPNVGKSSLMNAIVGFERSITFDQAGTTRDVLHAETVLDGLPIRLSDTAGLRAEAESIEKIGIRLAQQAASEADLILLISEPDRLNEPDRANQNDFQSLSKWPVDTPLLRVLNKADLFGTDPHTTDDPPVGYDVYSSTVTGAGIESLQRQISQQFTPLLAAPGEPAIINQRQQRWVRQIVAATAPETVAHTQPIHTQPIIDLLQSLGRKQTSPAEVSG